MQVKSNSILFIWGPQKPNFHRQVRQKHRQVIDTIDEWKLWEQPNGVKEKSNVEIYFWREMTFAH